MKNLSFLNKVIFFINNVFALLLLLSFIIPYVEPNAFPLISALSLTVPILLFIHILFIVYWILIGFKKQFVLSTIFLLLTITFSYFPYKFQGKDIESEQNFTVMNFNVRIFNEYRWIENENISGSISDFISTESPDILAIQEFKKTAGVNLNYPFKYLKLDGKKNKVGQAIFSKYKIVDQGSLNFKNSSNNAIFIDLIKDKDTIRVYNLHLETIGINAKNVDLGDLTESNSKKLLQRIEASFAKQQSQVEQFINHKNKCKYKFIICGDFNNTAYSWAYHKIKENLKDSFLVAGKGFGETFTFKKYPLRIDFILVDKQFEVNNHQNYSVKLSDHEPIMAKLEL